MFINDNLITKADEKVIKDLYDRLDGQFLDVISDVLLLSYTKEVMQALVKRKNTPKEEFLELAEKIIPLNFAESCYQGYLDIYKKRWKYLSFIEDQTTGYESIAFYKDEVLIIGIAGSDKSVEDWIDNDARLLIPRGVLVPTQFKIVGSKIKRIINEYKAKHDCNLPKEIIITGNSLGGAVTVVAYSEIYHFALANNIKLSALTYNSAPLRIEYIEELMLKKCKEYEVDLSDFDTIPFLEGIVNLINEDDLLNNILYIFIKNIENFDHLGKYLIIENKGELKETDLLHYAKEHINVFPIRDLTVSEVQLLEHHAYNMFDGSAQLIKKTIKEKVAERIDEYKEQVVVLDKIRGAMLGTAIADFYGNGKLEATDATKLTLAVAKGLIKAPDEPLPAIGDEVIEWQALDGKYIGRTTKVAIENALKTGSFPTGAKKAHEVLEGRTAGNCSLKRCLPVPLVYRELDIVITLSGLQSNMTHFDSKVKEACQLYSWLVYDLLKGKTKNQALDEVFDSHLYYGQYKNIKLEAVIGSSYVVDCLLNCLILFYNYDNLEDLLAGVDKIDNAREIASLAGGLIGLVQGLKGISNNLKDELENKIEILNIAGNLFDERMKEH